MNLASLIFCGTDAEIFLQRQASNDLAKLNSDQGVYVSFLNPQGKIRALGYLIKKSNQEFHFITQQDKAEEAKAHLEKFIVIEDVVMKEQGIDPDVASLLRMTEIENFTEGDTLIKLDLVEKYVSFTKGCFPGQEVLAKYKNIGLRKREERSSELTKEAQDLYAKASKESQEADLTKAIDLLKTALRENPKNEEAYETLGVILAKQGKIQEAIMVMHQLETINPRSIMAQTNLSIFYMKLGDKDTAEQHKAKGTVLQFEQALA